MFAKHNSHDKIFDTCPLVQQYVRCVVLCKKQLSGAGASNYIPQIPRDVITWLCPWYLLLGQRFSYSLPGNANTTHYRPNSIIAEKSHRKELPVTELLYLNWNRFKTAVLNGKRDWGCNGTAEDVKALLLNVVEQNLNKKTRQRFALVC